MIWQPRVREDPAGGADAPTLEPPAPTMDPAVRPSAAPETVRLARRRPALSADGRVKLLLAEDDRLSRERLEKSLETWGYEVTTVNEGGKALTSLLLPDAPRLALLDWEMPGMSGIEVCRLLRGRSDAPYVYIVLCTGRAGQRHLIDGLSAGADDYIRKPFDIQELEVRLRAGRRVVLLQDQLLDAQAELERRALHDSLTGVKNRGAIVDVLRRELSRTRRTKRPLTATQRVTRCCKSSYGAPTARCETTTISVDGAARSSSPCSRSAPRTRGCAWQNAFDTRSSPSP